MSQPTSTPRYETVTFTPLECQRRPLWILHILPLPLTPLLARKWDYILKRFQVWYQDSDGDDITLGTSTELVAAIDEIQGEHVGPLNFMFKKGALVGQEVLFAMMDECERVKIRFKVLGYIPGGDSIELDTKTREIKDTPPYRNFGEHEDFKHRATLPEEDVDEAILNEPVTEIKGKALDTRTTVTPAAEPPKKEDLINLIPEHDDLHATPKEWSPAPSPRFEPFANNETPLIDLGSSIPAPQTSTDAPDPPEEAPSESAFPGSFPADPFLPPANQPQAQRDASAVISAAVQRTVDELARLGHLTITAAQNSGFPVSTTESFNNARRTLDQGRAQLNQSLEHATRSVRENLARASTELAVAVENARTQFASARSAGHVGLQAGLMNAASNLGNAGRQIELAIARTTQQLQASGAVSQATADRSLQGLRNAAQQVQAAMEDVTLRIQRQIDAHALGTRPPPPIPATPASETVPPTPASADEEDIYGPPSMRLPGAFPDMSDVERENKVRECADRLMEMGFFTGGDGDSAMALAVATDGDLEGAIDVLDGRHSTH
jgi:hypothetical protein